MHRTLHAASAAATAHVVMLELVDLRLEELQVAQHAAKLALRRVNTP